ncbi:MAG: TolC family protein [Amoebophilaceae bacterium]|nr:TolC family protein [Amoebophilaceae bacterium]
MIALQRWFKKFYLGFSLYIIAVFDGHSRVYAKAQAISLQEAVQIALKENLDIGIFEVQRKSFVLRHRLSNLHTWLPKAKFSLIHKHLWEKENTKFCLESCPILDVHWNLGAITDKLFDTKIGYKENVVHQLTTNHLVEEKLKEVVSAYYKLALAQKKWEVSTTALQLAVANLKKEEARLKLGLISKIDYIEVDLALKKIKLTGLEQQEDLREKRRVFNLLLNRPSNEETMVVSNMVMKPIWEMLPNGSKKMVDLELAIQNKQVEIARTKLNKSRCALLSCLGMSGRFASDGYAYSFENKNWNKHDKHAQSLALGLTFTLDLAHLLLMPSHVRLAKMELSQASLALAKQKAVAQTHVENKKWTYHHAKAMHTLAEAQLNVSKQKLALVKERYRLNQIELLKVQQAQEVVQQAEIARLEYAFKVKEAEFNLYQLIGIFY